VAKTWRMLAVGGMLSVAATAAAEEKLVPVPESGQAGVARTYGPTDCPECAARAAAATGAVAVPAGAVPAGPTVVGDYRVGHIHEGAFEHLHGHSAYHPYLDILHQPFRQTMYGGAHARYYAGYRNVYTPNWYEFYVPRYYAPAAFGYDPYGPSYYGYGQTRSSHYGPSYYGPRSAARVESAVPPAPPSDYHRSGFRYTGEPGIYSPYGVGSSSYFGAYGSAGY
jgi:hypothetical protein